MDEKPQEQKSEQPEEDKGDGIEKDDVVKKDAGAKDDASIEKASSVKRDAGARLPKKRSIASVGLLLPALLTCGAVACTAANYQPLQFDESQIEQAQASVKNRIDVSSLKTKEVDESKRSDMQSDQQKAQAAASSNFGMKTPAGGYKDGTYMASSYGYRSNIKVQVVISGGKITSIKVLSEGEDRPYFTNAKAVIGRALSAQGTNVDTVSGATYSSKGILAAVKKCLLQASGQSVSGVSENAKMKRASGRSSAQKKKANASKNFGMKTPAGGYKDGTYTAKSYGYRSYITVKVIIKNGKVSDIRIVSENEDRPYFTNAKAVIKRVLSRQNTSVDTVSGATYSSRGILAAIKKCLKEAALDSSKDNSKIDENEPDDDSSGDKTDDGGGNTGKDDQGGEDEPADCKVYANGTWEGKGDGYNVLHEGGSTPITVSVVTKNDKIVSISVVSHKEDNPYFRWARKGVKEYKGVFDQVLSKQSPEVDVVSGATYSSKGLMAAIADALSKAKAALEEQDASGS